MSENGEKILLTITLLSGDAVQVSGPLANKVLCLGMLERAKDAVREFKPQKAQIISLEGIQNAVEKFTKPFRKD